jgi:hypothetical protein
MLASESLPGPARHRRPLAGTHAQRRPMRMIHLGPLVLADLPVDLGVVLEQQERAGEAKRIERAPA